MSTIILTTNETETVLDICTDALRKIGVAAQDAAATADEQRTAMRQLSRMLKAWQNREFLVWTYANTSVTLTTTASYSLSPARPIRIHSARLVRSGIETPMTQLTRGEYDELPNKATQGTPTCFYYDRQRESALFYVWPVLSVAAGETVSITYERELNDITDGTQQVDVPSEWYDAVVYGLASRLADDFAVSAPDVKGRAEVELAEALAADREGSVFMRDWDE